MKKKTKKLPVSLQLDAIVVMDFGGSSTKGIFAPVGGKAQSLCMEPEVAEVSVESLTVFFQNKLGATAPENECWVQWKEGLRAVGYLAQKYYANAGLTELKYERGVYKTLAAIWVVKEKLKLPAKLRVALGVLLPPGERESKMRFEVLLRNALADYLTPTGRMNVELAMFNCKPEGAGIYLQHLKAVGEPMKRKVCAFVTIGYRNCSVLISSRGVVEEGKTSDLGFVRCCEKVVAQTSGQTLEGLTRAIALSGANINPAPLQQLARSTTASGRKSEVQAMSAAIRVARAEYAKILISWLDNVIPRDVDEIVFGGGTADYLKNELRDRYLGKPMSWNAGMNIPAELDTWGLGNRLCDVYGMFLYLSSLVASEFNDAAKEIDRGVAVSG